MALAKVDRMADMRPWRGAVDADQRSSCRRRAYNAKTRLAVACPITSHVKGYPFEVPVANTGTITGVILADHVKNLDWQARKVVFEAKAPADVLSEVQERLRALLREPNTSKK